MIRTVYIFAALSLALPAAAQIRTYGRETTIDFAATGGIRNFQKGPKGSAIVYLQDRTQRWYQVTLSGPCFTDVGQETVIYRTGPEGRLDRFSSIAPARQPQRLCGIRSILRSDAPPSQPKVRMPSPREVR